VLLLDEPTLGVDPQSRDNILAAIQGMAGSGTTVLYTTHYMEEAERLCDRIAIMDEGQIVAVGTLEQLLEIVGMGEVVEIESTAPLPHPERLRAIPGFVKLEADGRRHRIFVTSAARAVGAIGRLFAEQGGSIDKLEVYPVNLERLFMHLTGHALRD
jgi:ABC-2 type transport system ATP-binding protein